MFLCMPGVGLMVRVAGLGSLGPEFKLCLTIIYIADIVILQSNQYLYIAIELIPGEVDSACHPSEVDKMSTSLLG